MISIGVRVFLEETKPKPTTTMGAVNRKIDSSIEGVVHSRQVLFTETVAGATFTGTVIIPAGGFLLDVYLTPQVLWDGTSAAIIIGDATDDDCWMTTLSLVATDLLVIERFQASNSTNRAGTTGAFVHATSGIFGQATLGARSVGGYFQSAGVVIGKATKTAATGTGVGRTLMTVTYATNFDIGAATVA